MISNASTKLIQSLKHKKFRQKYDLFIVEGSKSIAPILQQKSLLIKQIWHVEGVDFDLSAQSPLLYEVDAAQLKKVTQLVSPPDAIALVHLPEHPPIADISLSSCIYLDGVQDPGNVGAIIRIADWYGIDMVIRSPASADFYSNKVVQSTMGSISNVLLYTLDHETLLTLSPKIIASDMQGDSTWRPSDHEHVCLVIGNEGDGISTNLMEQAYQVATIPGADSRVAESLNAAISCAILCDRFFA